MTPLRASRHCRRGGEVCSSFGCRSPKVQRCPRQRRARSLKAIVIHRHPPPAIQQPDVCRWHPAPSATRSVSRGSWACRWAHTPRTSDAQRTSTYSHLLPLPRSCSPLCGNGTRAGVSRAGWCDSTSRTWKKKRLSLLQLQNGFIPIKQLHLFGRSQICEILSQEI